MDKPYKRGHFASSKAQKNNFSPRVAVSASLLGIAIFVGIILLLLFSDVAGSIQPCVGVVSINGEISMQRTPASLMSPGSPNAEDIARAIGSVKDKPNVKALVIKINSPGGSVVGSRLIRQALRDTGKPTVAYLSEVAASGGYYVASGADYIVADPDTLTGSIGVLTVFTDARGLLKKLGVNVTAVTSGEHKTMGAFFKGLSPSDKAIIQSIINDTYHEFVNVVIEGRGPRLDKNAFLSIADGRVLSGRQAYKIGMVDELGNGETAIKLAANLSNITYKKYEDIHICPIEITTLYKSGLFMNSAFTHLLAYLFPALQQAQQLHTLQTTQGLQFS